MITVSKYMLDFVCLDFYKTSTSGCLINLAYSKYCWSNISFIYYKLPAVPTNFKEDIWGFLDSEEPRLGLGAR